MNEENEFFIVATLYSIVFIIVSILICYSIDKF